MKNGDMEFVIAAVIAVALFALVLVDSIFISGDRSGVTFVKNPFKKRKEPPYDDDRKINRHYRR